MVDWGSNYADSNCDTLILTFCWFLWYLDYDFANSYDPDQISPWSHDSQTKNINEDNSWSGDMKTHEKRIFWSEEYIDLFIKEFFSTVKWTVFILLGYFSKLTLMSDNQNVVEDGGAGASLTVGSW